jgi:predicted dehydrogenase
VTLKVAIVGCGKFADDLAQQIRRIPEGRLIALYDAEPIMARQMCDRFGGAVYSDLDQLLSEARPDVVHITTPPQSHYSLAMRCLEAGCHVFVEKPFTMDAAEAGTLVAAAERRNRKVCVDHNLQFSRPAVRLRELVRQGFLGGPAVHVESYYCYDLSSPGYARAFLSDSGHWLRSLPGGLLQNVISHGIARIAEHLHSESPTVIAHAFTSAMLQSLGEHSLRDELRVMIVDEPTTAYFTFSSQMRPPLSQFRVLGPRNGVLIDDTQQTVITLRGAKHKSYLEHVLPPMDFAKQYVSNATSNVQRFVTRRLHMNEGMHELVSRFYASIVTGAPLPISYGEIVRSARIMDAVFQQIGSHAECLV